MPVRFAESQGGVENHIVPRLQPLPMFDEIPLVLPSNPSKVVVSTSFGKDSIAALIEALETYGPALVVAHYRWLRKNGQARWSMASVSVITWACRSIPLRGNTMATAAWTVAGPTSALIQRKPRVAPQRTYSETSKE